MNPDSAFPFVDFAMAISESKTGGIVMVRAAIVHRIRAGRNDGTSSIVNGPRIIIQKDPDVGSGNCTKVTELAKGGVGVIGSMSMTSIEPWAIDFGVAGRPTFCSDTLLH